jgi:hypothetical protein
MTVAMNVKKVRIEMLVFSIEITKTMSFYSILTTIYSILKRTYSSGNCSGFTPDSLLIPTNIGNQKRGKCKK